MTRKDKQQRTNYSTLEQHTRKGKRLLPPLSQLPNLHKSSWMDDRLPELLWAALLVTELDRKEALTAFRIVAYELANVTSPGSDVDVTHTGIMLLPTDTRRRLLRSLCSHPHTRTVLRPLLLFDELPARDEWQKAIGFQPDSTTDWERLKTAVCRVMDDHSQAATDCRWARVLAKVVAGGWKVPCKEQEQEILNYPNYGDQKKVRPSIRALDNALHGAMLLASPATNQRDDSWPHAFWKRCWQSTPCEPASIQTNVQIKPATTAQKVRDTRRELASHYRRTIHSTDIDAVTDGIFGLAAYALAILEELLRLGNSTSIVGRLGLRTLVECYITMSYLASRADDSIWMEYRKYGRGHAKLAFIKLNEMENPPRYVSLDLLSLIANEDEWMEFSEINIGNWVNSSLRDLSIQAGVKDEYDRYYDWTSAFVHGNWAAVRSAMFDICLNPLHRFHRLVKSETNFLEDVIADACTLVDKILEMVDKQFPPFPYRVTS